MLKSECGDFFYWFNRIYHFFKFLVISDGIKVMLTKYNIYSSVNEFSI